MTGKRRGTSRGSRSKTSKASKRASRKAAGKASVTGSGSTPVSLSLAGRGRTDWARVDAMTDEDIRRQIEADEDAVPEVTDEMLASAAWHPAPKKTPISFRVDPDILAYFKEQGPGYQSRMNAVLRAFMEKGKAK